MVRFRGIFAVKQRYEIKSDNISLKKVVDH